MIYGRERLQGEQLPVLREKLAAESGWKQDVSNPLESQTSAKSSPAFRDGDLAGRKPDEAFAQAATPQTKTLRRRSRRSGELERLERVRAAF
ncbi:MAG: hypothetical protein ACRKFN_00630 [Desulfitobacterium sp.]